MRNKWILITALLGLTGTWSSAAPPVVSDVNMLTSRQEFGEIRRNLSVMGNPLTIAGKTYEEGIGTHATSMFPVDIPDGAVSLQGSCGVDDGADGDGSIRFVVMSGSEVLWKSEIMKKGMTAADFSVAVPQGAKRLYLLADHVDNNSSDHADWVNLTWNKGNTLSDAAGLTINAEEYGMKPGIKEDQTAALVKMLAKARSAPGSKIVLPKGEYHFYAEGALKMSFHISNHDQPVFHPVSVPLVDMRNVTIEGNGSVFIFHGTTLPVLIMDSSSVNVKNIGIDYERAYYSQAVITALGDTTTDVSIDGKTYPYEIANNRITFIGEDWRHGVSSVMAFKKGTGHIAEGTADMGWSGDLEDLGEGKIRLKWDLKSKGLEVGDTLVMRSWGRPHPACVIYRAKDTVLEGVGLHQSMGMTLLAQRSENITMKGGGAYMRKGSGRVYSSGADATHFSNVKGKITVQNALFEGMMDDAINVHSTCLSIKEIKDKRTILCEYKHGQSVGFEVFLPGETLQFIAGPTLENTSRSKVENVRKLNTKEVLITLANDIPEEVKEGDAVENGTYYPEVVFRNNLVRNNRARGTLFTTPLSVIVESNLFDHSSGSAILLAGDAQGWYESGACRDVVIRYNKFVNNLTSRYQFTNAIISIYPEVRQLDKQKEYYHRNVIIEYNQFDTFDVPLLFAISTQNLVFRNNNIKYNNDYKAWGQPPFEFKRCSSVNIYNNKVTPSRQWSIKDCKLELTPESEVSFKK